MLQQQERFDRFRVEFNDERPHEALGQQPPTTIYQPSEKSFEDALEEPDYPLHDLVLTVSKAGSIWMPGRRCVYVGSALIGHPVGLREIDDDRWLVSFMSLELGYIEPDVGFDPAPNVLTH